MSVVQLRKEIESQQVIVSDLDVIDSKKMAFTLNGKTHTIKTLDLEQFFHFVDEFNKFVNLRNDPNLTPNELILGYYNVISQVAPTITLKDVQACSNHKLIGVWALIQKWVIGDQDFDGSKKKNLGLTESDTDRSPITINAADVVEEICYLYGYLPGDALRIDYKLAFALIKRRRKQNRIDESRRLLDLVQIQSISIGQFERYKQVSEYFKERFDDVVGNYDGPPIMPKRQIPVESTSALHFLLNATKAMKHGR